MQILDVIIGMLILSGISMACLGLYGWRFTARIPAAVPYTLLMFSAAAWAFLYAPDLLTSSLPLKVLFHNLRFLVLPFFSVLEIWLVLAFVKKTEWIRRDWAAVILVIPVISTILAITSPFHSLFRYNFSIDSTGPIPVLQYTESPFYTLYFLYSLFLLVLAIFILVIESRKRGTLLDQQTILLLIALAFPTVVNYLYTSGISPVPGVNMTSPLLWVPALLYTLALFRYRFLDIIPVARSRLVEIMSTPMLVLDMSGRIIDLNHAACVLFSTTSPGAIGRPVTEIASGWPDFLSLCMSEGTAHTDFIRRNEGGMQYYTGSVELIHTSPEEPEGRLVLLQDITEQKKAEIALVVRADEERHLLRSMMNAFVIFQSVFDDSGRFVSYRFEYINDAYEKITGVSLEEVRGKTVHEVWPETEPEWIENYGAVAVTGITRTFDMHHDPTKKTYHCTVYRPWDGNERFCVIFEDITERKRTEEALKASEEKFSLAFKTSPYAITITRAGDGRFIEVNDAFTAITGFSREDACTSSSDGPDIWVHSNDRNMIVKALREGSTIEGQEFLFRKKNGEIITGLFSAQFIEINGEPCILSSINDITGRKQAEESREALLKELAHKNDELDRFTYTVSHDLKSPLITIMGFIGMLKEDLSKNDSVQIRDDIERIASGAVKLERLINTLLALSRSGRTVDAPENLPFFLLAREAAGMVDASLQKRGITLVIPENLPVVSGDRQRLLQVLINLIDNAVKFMGDQKEPCIEIGIRDDGGSTIFFVRDNGMGISRENLPKVFGVFERLNPDIPGTGIGLSTVKRIIEAHGGRTWIESEGEGKGTTVCFTLPVITQVSL